MGYPTTAQLVADSNDAHLTGLTPTEQDALRASAINAIERHTGQRFEAEGTLLAPVTKSFPGNNGDTLWLPARLQELTGLEVVGSWLGPTDVAVSEDGAQLVIAPPNVAGGTWLDRAQADLESGAGPAVFPLGPDRVLVSGVWGWTDAEWSDPVSQEGRSLAAVRRAIRFDMEDHADADANELSETIRVARQLGVSSLSQGNLSVQMRSSGEPLVSERVRRELQGLRWTGPVVATA